MIKLALLILPLIRTLEIRQKVGREEAITSETDLTSSKIAFQAGSAEDSAARQKDAYINFVTIKDMAAHIPMTASDRFA